MSIQSNTQQNTLYETRYLATYRNVSFVVLINQQIDRDEFWNSQLKSISYLPNTNHPLNRTFLILNSNITNIDAIYGSDCLNNIASIMHFFGNNQQHYVEAILDFLKDTIPKNVPVALLNEMSYKCFYYVPENHNWKVPFSSFRRNTKINIFGTEFKETQSEYVRKFFFQSNYDLLFLEDHQEQTLNLIQTVGNQIKQLLTEVSSSHASNPVSTPSAPSSTIPSSVTSSVLSTALSSSPPSTSSFGSSLSASSLGGTTLGAPSASTSASTNSTFSGFGGGNNIFGNNSSSFGGSSIFGSTSSFGSGTSFGSSTNTPSFGSTSNNRFSNIFSK